jgi:DNA-binding SARP family transcriptional activator/TPR repeat protein
VALDGLKIELFGEFRVRRGEHLIGAREWGGQKTRSLLKLLLTQPGRAFSRDEILEALWPGTSPRAAERDLRVAVSRLRKALEPELERGYDSRYVLTRRPGYSFDRQADCWVDAWEFEEHRNRAEAARREGRLEEAIREYLAALDLARGELLAEDPYEEWTMEARGEWQERRLSVLSNLSECLALKGRYTEAIEAVSRALSLDEYSEELHRRLMLYRYCAGDQVSALRAYRRYARTLEEGLGAAPSPGLARLKTQIEARDVPGVDTLRRYPRPRRPLRFPYSLGRTPFVGRHEEYARLAGHLKETLAGLGGAVAVEGEAGVGKTRLVEEFLGYARTRNVRVLAGRCYERELGPPLEPITEALGAPADGKVFDLADDKPGYEQGPGGPGGPDGGRVYGVLFEELARRSRDENALVFFVDDVQWADPATLEFLAYAARRVSGERILLILAYRREDVVALSGWLARLAERRAVSTLSLGRLSPEDMREFVRRMSGRGFEGFSRLADFLHRESEGNPFYAVEYLRWLIESGVIEVDRRRVSSLKGEALRDHTLPSGVRSLIGARIDGFDEETRDLLDLAAVVGRAFELGPMARISGRSEVEAFDAIEPLISSGLVVETPQGSYRFSHDKMRQALYEGVGGPKRRMLHVRVAETLEEIGSEPAELAHHYLRAREWRPALENLVRAARKAEESHAWTSALGSYERALEIVGELPDPDERRFELLAARELLLDRVGRSAERASAVREMSELANRLDDPHRVARAHVRRIGLLATLSDTRGAEGAYREALRVFREIGDRAGEAQAHREMGYVYWMQRDYAAALEANLLALEVHRRLGDRWGEASDITNIVQVQRSSGNYERALEWAEKAVEIGPELGDEERSFVEAMHLYTLVLMHQERGDLRAALSVNLEILRLWNEFGRNKTWTVTVHNECGSLCLALGEPERALEHFRAAAELSGEMGLLRDEGQGLARVGLCLEQTGDHSSAADAYRRAAKLLKAAHELSGALDDLSARAETLALLANVLHRSLGEPEDAMKTYESAAALYRMLDDRGRLGNLLLGMAGLRWRVGDLEGSARVYEEALNLVRGQAAQEAAALASLGVVYRDLGRLKESVRRTRAALRLLRDLDDTQGEAYVLSSLAQSYRRLKQYPSALAYLKRSLRLRRKVGDMQGEAGVLEDLAKIREEVEAAVSGKGVPEVSPGARRRN